MISLAIDTSTNVMGIAIANKEKVIAEFITNEKKNHSIRVMPAIEHVLNEVNITPKQLDRIIVAQGPGSYTGVRIGVSIAKALAWSLNIPLVGISSLELLALNGRFFDGVISPIFDARRGQVYTGLYRFERGEIQAIIDDRIILAREWATELTTMNQPVLFLGTDVSKHVETFREKLKQEAQFGSLAQQHPRPGELAILGIQREPVKSVHHFSPNYVQIAEAEKKWLQTRKNGE